MSCVLSAFFSNSQAYLRPLSSPPPLLISYKTFQKITQNHLNFEIINQNLKSWEMPTRRISFSLLFNCLLLLSSIVQGIRVIPPSVPSTMRPLIAQGGDFVKMRPHKQPVFGGNAANGCLPKGFRHSSAPSRYVNSQPFGSCFDKAIIENPWSLVYCFMKISDTKAYIYWISLLCSRVYTLNQLIANALIYILKLW